MPQFSLVLSGIGHQVRDISRYSIFLSTRSTKMARDRRLLAEGPNTLEEAAGIRQRWLASSCTHLSPRQLSLRMAGLHPITSRKFREIRPQCREHATRSSAPRINPPRLLPGGDGRATPSTSLAGLRTPWIEPAPTHLLAAPPSSHIQRESQRYPLHSPQPSAQSTRQSRHLASILLTLGNGKGSEFSRQWGR